MDLKINKMYWLIDKKSPITQENKIIIYKDIIKSIWIYGIELWDCSSKSNINIVQRFQSPNNHQCSMVRLK